MPSTRPTTPAADGEQLIHEAAERAFAAAQAVHRHPVHRRVRPGTVAGAATRSAQLSAAIDGAPLTPAGSDATVGPVLAGALRVASALAELEPVWRRAPLQALARLHVLAAADLAPAARRGRPRPWAIEGLVAPELIPARLAGVAALALDSVSDPVPARGAVTVALVHAELLTLQPFGSADGVVARAAARLTMMTTGLDPRGLTLPEVGFLRSVPTYRAVASRYAEGSEAGRVEWITYACDAVVAGAREASALADSGG